MEITEELAAKARALKREYTQRWRAANRDRQKEYDLRYWVKRVLDMEAENGPDTDTAK